MWVYCEEAHDNKWGFKINCEVVYHEYLLMNEKYATMCQKFFQIEPYKIILYSIKKCYSLCLYIRENH